LDENTKGGENLEWKVLIMLSLLIFAATTIVIDLAMTSLLSTLVIDASLSFTLDSDFIEPLGGDPVDIDEFPT
jgi:hypothetical protein